MAHLYDGVTLGASPAGAGEAPAAPRFLTYAPFPEPVAGFAWALALLAPDRYPAHARRARPAQEIGEVLFRGVDLGACQRALDIGCGEGADLVALALAHPGLVLDGYTLSGRQAERARAAVRSRGLDHRVHVYQRDSVADPFPSRYDLAFGFEVVHHVPDRAGLLRHVGRHLHDGGAVVLADFVAHGETAIEDRASASVFATAAEWAADLAQGGLEAVALVDASPEIANFLQDEDAEESFRALQALGIDPAVVAAFRSYHRGGELLRRGLASYVLLTARKRAGADPAALARRTRETLAAPRSYGALLPARCCYQVEWRLAPRPIAALHRRPR